MRTSAIATWFVLTLLTGCRRDAPRDESGIATLAANTLFETLSYRQRFGRHTFDPAIRELLAIVCHDDAELRARIASNEIEALFPLAHIAEGTGAGCGYLVTPTGRKHGIAFASSSPDVPAGTSQ